MEKVEKTRHPGIPRFKRKEARCENASGKSVVKLRAIFAAFVVGAILFSLSTLGKNREYAFAAVPTPTPCSTFVPYNPNTGTGQNQAAIAQVCKYLITNLTTYLASPAPTCSATSGAPCTFTWTCSTSSSETCTPSPLPVVPTGTICVAGFSATPVVTASPPNVGSVFVTPTSSPANSLIVEVATISSSTTTFKGNGLCR